MFRTTAAAFVSIVCVSALPATAADRDSTATPEPRATTAASTSIAEARTPPAAADVDSSLPPIEFGVASRGSVLPALYVSFAGLQAYDGYATLRGVKRGAMESNSMMSGVAGNSAAMWAVKGSITFGSIFMAEKLWRQHRRAEAIGVMVASNAIMAAVAAHNASVMRGLR